MNDWPVCLLHKNTISSFHVPHVIYWLGRWEACVLHPKCCCWMHKCFFPEGRLRQEWLSPAVANTVIGVNHLFNLQWQQANSFYQHLKLFSKQPQTKTQQRWYQLWAKTLPCSCRSGCPTIPRSFCQSRYKLGQTCKSQYFVPDRPHIAIKSQENREPSSHARHAITSEGPRARQRAAMFTWVLPSREAVLWTKPAPRDEVSGLPAALTGRLGGRDREESCSGPLPEPAWGFKRTILRIKTDKSSLASNWTLQET